MSLRRSSLACQLSTMVAIGPSAICPHNGMNSRTASCLDVDNSPLGHMMRLKVLRMSDPLTSVKVSFRITAAQTHPCPIGKACKKLISKCSGCDTVAADVGIENKASICFTYILDP